MARDTDRRIEANLMNPEFRKLLEEAQSMVKEGKKTQAAYHILQHMDLEKDENKARFCHIPDRQLGEMIGTGKSIVSNERQRLKQERWDIERVVKNVDASKMKVIGRGSESVYLYYFPTYQLFNKLCLEVPYFPCNIGRTTSDVKTRVSDQIGQQLPEKSRIALIIRTDDCEALEKKIHEKLKRENLEDTVGEEWFLTNPAEVEGIVKSIHNTKNSNE